MSSVYFGWVAIAALCSPTRSAADASGGGTSTREKGCNEPEDLKESVKQAHALLQHMGTALRSIADEGNASNVDVHEVKEMASECETALEAAGKLADLNRKLAVMEDALSHREEWMRVLTKAREQDESSFGGMFGSAAPAGGGLVGQSSSGGIFGAAPASGGGLFGAPAAAPANPNAMEANFKQIGEQFAQAYYQTYDAKQNLATFYEENSLFTFEGQDIQGAQNIMQKLGSLGFQQVQHAVQKCQCQPVPGSPDKVLVTVIGDMMVNGSQKVKFVEIFQLMKKPTGNWFVLNNTFNVIT